MLTSLYQSSIGKKILVALTGLVLVGFILGHMIGNLLVFMGPEAINEYGHMMIWVARAVIFGSIALHVILTVQLTRANSAARDTAYGKEHTQVASKSSRTMILSGLTILAFFIYHILHFTTRSFNQFNDPAKYSYDLHGETVHNVFRMVIDGFSSLPVSVFYIIAMLLLSSHLSHGVSSLFQTLGLGTSKTRPLFNLLGKAFAALILVGNCSIPVAIYFFHYGQGK
jgi:succinate dehydrogenase / fumarate reductase, cytochrome b subunit